MKTKVLILAALVGMTALTEGSAIGLGVQFNLHAGRVFRPGAALALSPSDTTHLAVNWYFGETSSLGLTLDVRPLNLALARFGGGSLDFTLGGGVFTNLVFSKPDNGFDGGLRLPIGLSLWLGGRTLEFYTHVAPSFGLRIVPELGIADPFFPLALGVRLYFR
jgi:hypothetical protein